MFGETRERLILNGRYSIDLQVESFREREYRDENRVLRCQGSLPTYTSTSHDVDIIYKTTDDSLVALYLPFLRRFHSTPTAVERPSPDSTLW